MYRVDDRRKIRLSQVDPDETDTFTKSDREQIEIETAKLIERIGVLQEVMFASRKQALLVILQAMDAGGKDGTVKQVFAAIHPQGISVANFKVPSAFELAHDFLWRVHAQVPPKGLLGVFNRSHYEDVLVTRVHGLVSQDLAEERFGQIRDFETLLVQTRTRVLKFFLHISADEQRERLQERIDTPSKRWKFNLDDLKEREHWDAYMRCYEEAITATGTQDAPWFIVPANKKWYRNYIVAKTVVQALEEMDLRYPSDDEVDWASIRVK